MRPQEQRKDSRVEMALPAEIRIGSQLSLQGKLKDLSLKGAFITIRASVYLQMNDEVGFAIQPAPGDAKNLIEGMARISRIAVGEGLAIYFTRLDDASAARLKSLVQN